MTLRNFIKGYRGISGLTIIGYCDDEEYDYYLMPKKEQDSGNEKIHCLNQEEWWDEVKSQRVKEFQIVTIENHSELVIWLEN